MQGKMTGLVPMRGKFPFGILSDNEGTRRGDQAFSPVLRL